MPPWPYPWPPPHHVERPNAWTDYRDSYRLRLAVARELAVARRVRRVVAIIAAVGGYVAGLLLFY